REPQNVAFHLPRLAHAEGEVGGLERVLRIGGRVSRDEEAASRGQDRPNREHCGPFAIRERPSGHVQRLRTRIPDLDELVVAGGARVDADEQRIRQRVLGKRGGGRPRKREEGFGLALRPKGGGCQDERREQGRSRTPPGTPGFAARMRSTAFVMTSGFAVVTLTSPPISSGGSIAMYSGDNFASVSASARSSAHAITSRPIFWHRGMLFAISSHATLRSLWLI